MNTSRLLVFIKSLKPGLHRRPRMDYAILGR